MAYKKIYELISYENRSSRKSPISADNLNKMENAINTLDDRIVEMSGIEDDLEERLKTVETEVTPIERGGTGAKTAKAAQYKLLSNVNKVTSDITDLTEFAGFYNSPAESTGAVYSRTALTLWNYIKSKISSVLGLDATNYKGTSAKATADASGNTITSTYATQTEMAKKYDSTTSRTANTVLASPDGSAGAATFRNLVANDLPTVPAAKGGTGKTSLINSANALINALTTESSVPTDNDYFVSQYASGGTTTTTYHRRPVSALWTYIQSKISSVLGLTAASYRGNAATATKATQDANGSNIANTYAKKSIYSDTTVNYGRTDGSTVGESSFAFGGEVAPTGKYSQAFGYNTKAYNYSFAEGKDNVVEKSCAHVEGEGNTLNGTADWGHAEGYYNTASEACAHAEGYKTTASGQYSHSEGGDTVSSGMTSHAEGHLTTASNYGAHAEGAENTASGIAAHAEGRGVSATGDISHAEGRNTTASGDYSHAEGYYTTASSLQAHAEGCKTSAIGYQAHAEGYCTTALELQHAQGHYNDTSLAKASTASGTSTGTAFVIGNGTSSAASNAFRVTNDGKTYAKASYNSTGADYAEFAEWADGNPDDEDRRGYFVTFDEDKPHMIRKANAGEYILGIISGNPCVIGNSDEGWVNKYVFDEFGAFVYEEQEAEVEYVDDETGDIKTKTEMIMTYKLNPDYDPAQTYVHRDERPEWDYVGWIGVLSVYDDGTCVPGSYCTVTDGGIATAAKRGTDTYRVLSRVNDNIIKVALK